MRVGLLIYGSLDIVSGGYLYDRTLVEYLQAQGDEVIIYSLPWRNYGAHLLDNFRPNLYEQLVSAEIDILIQDELNHPSLFLLNRRLRKRVTYPIVSIVHNLRCLEPRTAWHNRLYKQVERAYFDSLDGIICNSATTQSAVQSLTKNPQNQLVAQPAGDRLLAFASQVTAAKQSETFRLLFVASVTPLKGLHTLLDALALADMPNWSLRVVGDLTRDAAYVAKMRTVVNEHGWQERVTFCGVLDGAALAEQYINSDLFVLPSGYEGFGIVLLEAMGFGLPTIGTTRGAMHELVVDEETGYLVSAENPQQLTEKIQLLHANPAQLQQMSIAAKQRFDTFPTWAQSCEKIRQFLLSF